MFDTHLECILTSTHCWLLRRVLELGQRLERVLRTARQHHSVAGDPQAAEWHDDQSLAHAEEAAHRQHGVSLGSTRRSSTSPIFSLASLTTGLPTIFDERYPAASLDID